MSRFAKSPKTVPISNLGRLGFHAKVPKFKLVLSRQQRENEDDSPRVPAFHRPITEHGAAPSMFAQIPIPGSTLLESWARASKRMSTKERTRRWALEGGMIGGFSPKGKLGGASARGALKESASRLTGAANEPTDDDND